MMKYAVPRHGPEWSVGMTASVGNCSESAWEAGGHETFLESDTSRRFAEGSSHLHPWFLVLYPHQEEVVFSL